MSGSYDDRDGFVVAPKIVSPFEEAIIISLFDEQVNYDIEDYKKEQKEIKNTKNACLIKIVLLPLQYPLTRIFLGKELAQDTWLSAKLYWKFVRNKISFKEFNIQLSTLLKESRGKF